MARRSFSSQTKTLLTREFIHDRLYAPKAGYFNKEKLEIGRLPEPLNFIEMVGFDDYQASLSKNYPEYAWLTPSEIFRPYYGMTIGNYIEQVFSAFLTYSRKKSERLKIIEVGAGFGSAASGILDFFKFFDKRLYDRIEYTIVEISTPLIANARDNLMKNHEELFKKRRVRFVNDSMEFYSLNDDDKVFVIFLEVLDNMPHDRVYLGSADQSKFSHKMLESLDYSQFEEASVEVSSPVNGATEALKEIRKPLSDPKIKEAMQLYLKYLQFSHKKDESADWDWITRTYMKFRRNRRNDNVFLPTTCLSVLKNLTKVLPNHHLIIGDFDMLRESSFSREGVFAPIVSKKLQKPYEKKDFSNYLVQKGEADIFFPTDFSFLRFYYQEITGKRGKTLKSHKFVDEFSKDKWVETKSGYNPLKEDFGNTSIMVTLEDFIKL